MTIESDNAVAKGGGKESDKLPHCVYFYLVTFNGPSSHPTFKRHYHDAKRPISDNEVDDLVKKLLAEPNLEFDHHSSGGTWKRFSYLIYVTKGAEKLTDIDLKVVGGHTKDAFKGPYKLKDQGSASGFYYLNEVTKNHVTPVGSDGKWAETFEVHPHPDQWMRSHEDTGTNMGPPTPPPAP